MEPTAVNPFGLASMNNSFESEATWDFEKSKLDNDEKYDVGEALKQEFLRVRTEQVRETVAKATDYFSDVVSEAMCAVWEGAKAIIRQAVKMAMFKFAIEACAMGIKSLVEMMLGMSLTPPNIDTKGVFYNFGNSATAATVSSTTHQPSSPTSGYSNPFGSPFGSSAW